MRKETVYIAFDETKFRTEQACINYEKDFKDALTSRAVILFDSDFNRLSWNEETSEIEDGIYYIYIVDADKCIDVFDKLDAVGSLIVPNVPLIQGHILMFEDSDNWWIDLTKKVSELNRRHDIISASVAKFLVEGK